MTLQGPDLTPFQQAKQIRSVFFNSEGGKKFSWSMQISVVDMDPAITELVIDIDGQVLRYAHGPDRPRGRQLVEYDFDGRRVVLEITAGRDFNPVSRELLQNFSCPARAL